MSSTSIFPTGGVSVSKHEEDKEAFITLSWWPLNSASRTFLVTNAPATDILITEGVDYNITKALQGDFFLAAFGDKPVTILIKGLHVYDTSCSLIEGNMLTRTLKSWVSWTLPEFYNKTKVSTNPDARVKVDIEGRGKYACAVTALELIADEAASYTGICTYKLEMVGVADYGWMS